MTPIIRMPKRQPKIADLVDELGSLKVEIAKLEERQKEIVEELKTHGAALYKGDTFEANVFEQARSTVDWWGLSESLHIAKKTIQKFTRDTTILVCKVGLRSSK